MGSKMGRWYENDISEYDNETSGCGSETDCMKVGPGFKNKTSV